MTKTLTGGSFQSAAGTLIASGKLILTLSQDAMILVGGQVKSSIPVVINLDASGDVSGSPVVFGNDELSPTGTFYYVDVLDSSGNTIREQEKWVLTGTSPINLDTIVPTLLNPDPGFANPVLQNPTASQTITGQALTLTSSAPLTVDTETVGKLDNILFVDGVKYTTIQAAHDAVSGNNARIVVAVPLTVSAVTNITKSGITLEFLPNAVLTKSAGSFVILNVTGSDVEIRDGVIDASASTGGSVIKADDGFNLRVLRMKITNPQDNAINVHNITGGQIEGNKVTQNGASGLNGIFVRNGSSRIRISNNEVIVSAGTDSQADAIAIIAETSQSGPAEITVTGNTLRVGAVNNFGVEAGNFGGVSNPTNVTVFGNSIKLTASSGGGISFGSVSGGAISGNTVDANAQTISVAGIEVVNASTNVAVTGNQITGSTGTRNGISVDQSSGCSVTGNVVKGFGTAVDDKGIVLVSNTATAARRNVILGNTIEFDPSTTNSRTGIWLQSNHASADVSDNIVALNSIVGAGTGNGIGIHIQHDAGTLARTQVSMNQIRNLNVGINRETGQTDTRLYLNVFDTVTSSYGGLAGTNEDRVLTQQPDKGLLGERFSSLGTALVSGDFALSAGWGTTGALSAITGTDQGAQFTVTPSGTGIAANPTATLTFKDGTWTNSPILATTRGDTNTPTTGFWSVTSVTATQAVFTFVGLPVTGTAYTMSFVAMGR